MEGTTNFAIYDAQGQKVYAEVAVLADDKRRITLSQTGIFYVVTAEKTFKLVSQ